MAAFEFNQQSNVGFYKAPVSKSLLLFVGSSHVVSHIPSFSNLFKRIFSVTVARPELTSLGGLLRIVASKLVFPDTKSTILALVLIYFFRVFERRFGSLRLSSNLFLCWGLTVSLELALSPFIDLPLSPGPLSIILPLFVPFYYQIPLTSSSQFGPVHISTKSLTYLLGLQLALTSPSTIIASILSLLTGCLVFLTPLSHKFKFPSLVGSLLDKVLGPIIKSGPPTTATGSGLLGATLEIQRTQQAEAIEQQLMRSRAARFNVPIGGRQMRLDEMWRGGGGQNQRRRDVNPSPDMVAVLTDMGFSRDRAEAALIQNNNNIDQATNQLLQDM